MKKLTLSLLLSLALGSASAQTNTPTSISSDARLSAANVSINVGTYGGPLSSLLAAVAHSAGYEVIFDTNVDAAPAAISAGAASATPNSAATTPTTSPVVYNFANTPFNQVWPLLMDTYGLSYEVLKVGDKSVLRVGTTPIQKIVKLNNANAQDILNQVKLSFGTPQYSETPVKNSDNQTIGTTRTLTDVKLDSPTLRIVADTRSNSLIVRGTNREVNDVEQTIQQIDNSNTNAADTNNRRVYTVQGDPADIQKVINAQYPLLKVDSVGQTKQIILSGDEKALTAALNLLNQVDKPVGSGPDIQQKVFQLVNANADDVKKVLDNTLKRDITANNTTTPPTTPVSAVDAQGNPVVVSAPTAAVKQNTNNTNTDSNSSQEASPAGQATIISDKRTNTLIVRGTAQQVAQIAELIPQLDQVVPQINVQVRIQEVSQTAARTLGLTWNASAGAFNLNVGNTSGLAAAFDPTRALVSGLNILPTLTALERETLTKNIYDGSVTMQSGQGSVPLGLPTAPNISTTAAASISSGGTIQLNIPSVSGNITNPIPYGVNIDFYDPQVAPDGTITMRIHGRVATPRTDLSTVGAGTIPYILDFATSEAQSVIKIKSGQTMLLTGLLSSTQNDNSYGVPYLSSIPVLGKIVGNHVTSSGKSQLMIVITANIIK